MLHKRISYSRDTRARAKEKSTWLVTVDTRSPTGTGGSTLQSSSIPEEHLDWFMAFAIQVLSLGESPETAWRKTYGSPNCPVAIRRGSHNLVGDNPES